MNDKIRAILNKINEEPNPLEAKEDVVLESPAPVKEVAKLKKEKLINTKPVTKAKPIKASTKKMIGEEAANNPDTEGFLANMINEVFSYEKRKYAFIEPRIFEILMQVKIKKDIKNISVIVNTILDEYITKHQVEIRKILETKF